MPPRAREAGVATRERLTDRYATEESKVRDGLGIVECQSLSHVGAAIVTHDGVTLVAEHTHQRGAVARHRAFRVRLVIGRRRRFRRLAIAAQIRAHDRPPVGEQRSNPVPRRVRSRMPVQEQQPRPRAPVAHAQRHPANIDPLQLEPLEHLSRSPFRTDRKSGRENQRRR